MKGFSQLITDSELPVLVDFHADWCAPCHLMAPVLQDIAREMKDRVRIIKIDVDRNPEAARKYGIRGIPTFILFFKGSILWRGSGVMQHQQLKNILFESLTTHLNGKT